jgi:hypothetical protein
MAREGIEFGSRCGIRAGESTMKIVLDIVLAILGGFALAYLIVLCGVLILCATADGV